MNKNGNVNLIGSVVCMAFACLAMMNVNTFNIIMDLFLSFANIVVYSMIQIDNKKTIQED